jgi:hypothetical protein
MAYGEYDVYSAVQESFLRAARAHGVGGQARAAAELDMFGDDEPAAPDPPAAPEAPVADQLQWEQWSISQLKRFLELRGRGDVARAAVEKNELQAAARAAAGASGLALPAGYAFQPSSGLYAAADGGMLFDIGSGLFASAGAPGAWYRWSGTEFEAAQNRS